MSTHVAIATTAVGVLEEVQLPTPTPGKGEVLIHELYAAMIAFDTYQLDQGFAISSYPQVLGFSGAGEIKAIGEGVSDLKVGDKVIAFTIPAAQNKALQEYVLVTRGSVAKLPPSYPLDAAVSFPDNYVTAFWMLFGPPNLALPVPATFPASSPPLGANEPVVVYGVSASSGQYTVQLLKLAGYKNIISIASSRNHALLQELGASKCVDYRSANLAKDILEATGGVRAHLAVDTIATKASLEAVRGVSDENTRVAVLAPVKEGETVTNAPDSPMHLTFPDWVSTLFQGISIVPVYTFRSFEDEFTRENVMPKILPQLLENKLLQPNRIRLIKDGSLKARAELGLDLLRNNRVSGEKVVIQLHD